jgi:hypothetical protein
MLGFFTMVAGIGGVALLLWWLDLRVERRNALRLTGKRRVKRDWWR